MWFLRAVKHLPLLCILPILVVFTGCATTRPCGWCQPACGSKGIPGPSCAASSTGKRPTPLFKVDVRVRDARTGAYVGDWSAFLVALRKNTKDIAFNMMQAIPVKDPSKGIRLEMNDASTLDPAYDYGIFLDRHDKPGNPGLRIVENWGLPTGYRKRTYDLK